MNTTDAQKTTGASIMEADDLSTVQKMPQPEGTSGGNEAVTTTTTNEHGMTSTHTTNTRIDSSRSTVNVMTTEQLRLIIDGSEAPLPLSGGAEIYHGELKEALKRRKYDLIDLPINGNYIATNGELAIHICFPEYQTRTLQNESRGLNNDGINVTPECGHINLVQDSEVYRHFMSSNNYTELQSFIVPTSDYYDPFNAGANSDMYPAKLGARVGNIIANEFDTYEVGYTFDAMYKLPLRINTDYRKVMEDLRNNHVHNVLPNVTTGFTVEICTDPTDNRYAHSNWKPFFTVGARVDMIKDDGPDFGACPVVNITAFASNFRSELLLPWMYITSYMVFLTHKWWEAPFTAFGESRFHNLGDIIIDPETKQPVMINDMETYRNIRNRVVGNPILAVDTRFGEYLHPAINMLMHNDQHRITNMFTDLGVPKEIANTNAIYDTLSYFTGIAVDNDQYVDSRAIDYFRLASQISNDPDMVEHFRNYFDNPEDHLRSVSAAGWDNAVGRNNIKPLTSLYSTTKHILNASTICDLTFSCVPMMNVIRNMRVGDQPAFDQAGMREQGRIFNSRERGIPFFRQSGYQGRPMYGHNYRANRANRY